MKLLNKLFPKATEQGAKTLGEVTSKGLRETFNVGKNVIQGFTNDQIKYLRWTCLRFDQI